MLRFPNGCSRPRKPTARSAASTGRRVRSWPLTPTSPSGHSFCPMAARRTSAGRRNGPAEPPESRPKATEPTVTIDSRPARVRVSSVGRRHPPIRGRARRRCRPGQAIGCRLRRRRGVRCRVGAAVEGSEAGVRALRKRCPGYDQGEGRRRWRALDLGTIPAFLEADSPRCVAPNMVLSPRRCRGRVTARSYVRVDDSAAWLVTHCSKSAVRDLLRVAWCTVGPAGSGPLMARLRLGFCFVLGPHDQFLVANADRAPAAPSRLHTNPLGPRLRG